MEMLSEVAQMMLQLWMSETASGIYSSLAFLATTQALQLVSDYNLILKSTFGYVLWTRLLTFSEQLVFPHTNV